MRENATAQPFRVLLWHWGRHGGGPRFTFELARALRERVEVHLSLSRQTELFELGESLDLPGFYVDTYTGMFSAARNSLTLPGLRRKFVDYLRAAPMDVVLCTMNHLWNPAIIGSIHRAGIPFVTTVHDAVLHRGDVYPLRRWLLEKEIRSSDGVIALCEHVRRQILDIYSYPSDRVWVVRHGVFNFGGPPAARRTFPRTRPFRLLFFGRILPYKGLGMLLDAFETLDKKYSLELCIAGSGDAGPYKKQIDGLAHVRLDNRWIPDDEIERVLNQADLVVLPYLEASQSGIAPAAYGAGIPVVASPVGGLIEQVRHLETGILAEDVSSDGLIDAIATLLDAPDLYDRCAAGALRYGQEQLSWPRIAAEVDKILRQICAKHPSGGGRNREEAIRIR